MKDNFYAVVMAGGVGSRFWPVSTKKFPKQFHDMLGTGNSLLQNTVNRANKMIPSENILIATNQTYTNIVKEQLPKIKNSQIIPEPVMRNTAPCILLSAFKIYKNNNNAIMLIAPSDHFIENELEFLNNIETAYNFCSKNNALLTLGITPDNPNTGYGYIQFNKSGNAIEKVLSFKEKPNLKTAQMFLNEGNYVWNAGIFVWSVSAILEAFEKHLPAMYNLFKSGMSVYNTPNEEDFIAENYHKAENISIDFGIMEKANNVFVTPVNFGWNDLGTWSSLHSKLPKDVNLNASIGGQVIFRNSKNNIVKTSTNKHIVIQGLNNFIVVENSDTLLICPITDEQEIKSITNEVQSQFGDDFI